MAIQETHALRLVSLIDATREAVATDVASAEHTADLRAVAQLSGHLAAMRRAVYPAARRMGAPGSWQAAARELDWALLLRLAARYRRALAHAPTRPHPRDPRARVAYRVAFAVHGLWDRMLDTTDSRPWPGWPATVG